MCRDSRIQKRAKQREREHEGGKGDLDGHFLDHLDLTNHLANDLDAAV